MPAHRSLDLVALLCWLVTEALGGIMLRGWIVSGGAARARREPRRAGGMSLPVLAGHAGLNLTGLLCWVVFVVTGERVLAWVALGFMAPAIGLGISTVTIWTPYPGGRPKLEEPPPVIPDDVVKRALENEALGQRLVDELLERNLGQPQARKVGLSWRPLIPAGHGVLAIITFFLATLAAVAAV